MEAVATVGIIALIVMTVIILTLLPSRPPKHHPHPTPKPRQPERFTAFNDTNLDHSLFLSDGREYAVPAHGSVDVADGFGLLATSDAFKPDGAISETKTPIPRGIGGLYLTYGGVKTDREVEADGQLINNTRMPVIFITYSQTNERWPVKYVKPWCKAIHVIAAGSKWQVVHQAEEQTILGEIVVHGRPKSLIFDGFSLKQSNDC